MRNNCQPANHAFWPTGLSLLLFLPAPCSAEQSDLLSLVRAGHRAARQSIRSFSAAVTHEVTFADKRSIVITGRYWRSLDVVRVQEKQGAGTEDYLLRDAEIRQVGQGAGSKRGGVHYSASRRASVETLCLVDVWTLMMIDSPGPNGGHYDFDRFLEFAKETPQARREKKDGHDCIRLSLTIVSTKGLEENVTRWHDVDRNHLAWKETVTDKGSPDLFESEILEFSEPLPGVFIPMKCRRQVTREGERVHFEEVTLSEVQVNKPIPNSVFELPAIPSGTILNDKIKRTRYPIDANWRPIGPASPHPQLVMPAPSDGPASDYHSQSTTEPVPFSRGLTSVSLAILVAACTFLLYRRYRLRARLQKPN